MRIIPSMPSAVTMRALTPLLVTASLMDWPAPMPDVNDFWRGSALQDARLPTLKETDGAFQIHIAAAGIKPEDISLSFDRGILRVTGESHGEREGWMYSNTVERSIRLPTDKIDEEHIEAMNDHGMIVIKVPKMEKHKGTAPRLIPIKPVDDKAKALEDKVAQKSEV